MAGIITMELISKQSKDVMGQELLVKMSVADLVVLESVLSNNNNDQIFEALHYSSTTCQSSESHIYNGEHGVFEYMERNPKDHYEQLHPKVSKLLAEVFNIQD